VTLRAFLVGPTQDRTALLARETLVTAALAETGDPMGKICVSDASGRLDPQDLGQKVALQVDGCDPTDMAEIEGNEIDGCPNAVDFAVAYGAALPRLGKDASVSFRNDHMPFLGKKMRVQKAVRFLSVCLAILLLSVGIYFQAKLIRVNRQRAAIRDKLESDYLAVMLNKRKLPSTMKDAAKDVEGELRRVMRGKSGEWTDQASVPAKLEQVFRAVNSCARQTDLNLRSVSISSTIIMNGDTSSRSNQRAVLDALEKVGLKRLSEGISDKEGRVVFTATLEPQKTAQ
jgi:hypothetical protein